MAKFKGAVLQCEVCGSEFKVPPSRAAKAKTCSHACSVRYRAEAIKRQEAVTCARCGKEFQTPRCHAGRRKFCSYECKHTDPAYLSRLSRVNSGAANAMWKGGVVAHSSGYICRLAPHHPFSSNNYVLEHRLVMECWLRENDPDSCFLVRLGDQLYLTPEIVVHHVDEDKANNAIGNLQCMTLAEHTRLHSLLRAASKKRRGP